MVKAKEKREKRYGDATKRAQASGKGGHLSLPKGIQLWEPKAGAYNVDVVPYLVTDANNKFNPKINFATPGQYYYERTYYVHQNIGVNKDKVVCPAMTFGKKCPICERRAEMDQDPKFTQKEKEHLFWSQRMCLLVSVREEADKGVMLFDVSNHAFGKQLNNKINMADPADLPRFRQFFRDDEKGMTLRITGVNTPMGTGGSYILWGIDKMTPRKKALSDALMAHGVNLDEVPLELSYKDLDKMFYVRNEEDENGDEDEDEDETDDEESEDEESDDEESDEEESEDDDEESDEEAGAIVKGSTVQWVYKGKKKTGTVKKINSDTGLVTVEVAGQDKPSTVNMDELMLVGDEADDEDEDEDEDEAPVKKPKPGKKPAPKADDDDDEEEEEDEDEEDEEEDEDDSDEDDSDDTDDDDDSESDDEDDDEEEEEEEDDEDEEDEEPAPRKKPKPKPKPGKKPRR